MFYRLIHQFLILLFLVSVSFAEIEVPFIGEPDPEIIQTNTAITSPSETKASKAQLKLALELTDGSRVIGVPLISIIPLKTDYGSVDLKLDIIESIDFPENGETVSISFANGDQLKGEIGTDAIELETLFGRYSIALKHIVSFEVYNSDNLAILQKGLVLYYSFNNWSEDKVTDRSDKKNHGKVHGAKWTVKGKKGGAYEFDGENDWIGVKYTESLAPTREISFAAWAFRDDWASYTKVARILSKTHAGGWQIGMNGSEYGSNGIGAIAYRNGAYGKTKTDRTTLSRGWHHLTGTSNGHLLHFYIDGKLVATDDAGLNCSIVYRDKNALIIGGEAGSGPSPEGNYYFNGKIDEIMIFNRALSEKEIKQIYNSQK
ncbi:LamG domain-containing protein [Verrucomicrobiota bacterium]